MEVVNQRKVFTQWLILATQKMEERIMVVLLVAGLLVEVLAVENLLLALQIARNRLQYIINFTQYEYI